jgi:hypothetical protein
MPNYLLLKHYRGGPDPYRPFPPMDQWAPEDVEAHMTSMRSPRAPATREYVDGRALTRTRTWVRNGGPDPAPVITDGPHPETSDLLAGRYMVDVDSHERGASWRRTSRRSPGPGGELYEWIDVREVTSQPCGPRSGATSSTSSSVPRLGRRPRPPSPPRVATGAPTPAAPAKPQPDPR